MTSSRFGEYRRLPIPAFDAGKLVAASSAVVEKGGNSVLFTTRLLDKSRPGGSTGLFRLTLIGGRLAVRRLKLAKPVQLDAEFRLRAYGEGVAAVGVGSFDSFLVRPDEDVAETLKGIRPEDAWLNHWTSASGRWTIEQEQGPSIAGPTGALLVTDTRTGAKSVLRGHEGEVLDACFGMSEGRLATCSVDGTVRVWDLQLARELLDVQLIRATEPLLGSPDFIRFAPGESGLVVGHLLSEKDQSGSEPAAMTEIRLR